jgi:hypothetical protein
MRWDEKQKKKRKGKERRGEERRRWRWWHISTG